MATGTVLAWSIGIVIGRGIFELTPPVGLSFWRWFIPTLCLAPWVIPRIREEGITLIKTWKPLCAMGIFMVGSSAVSIVGVNRSAIFVNLIPVFGAALSITFLNEQLHLYHIVGASMICSRILLVVKGHKSKSSSVRDSAT
ncbi:MAG: DMT family transporter [Pseudomonadota bacterium]|nr:DMT family transporter [Pseudomonadota bacterium]